MAAKRSTRLVVNPTNKDPKDESNPSKLQLEKRAARFGVSASKTPDGKPLNPEEAEKLAKRAARFSDIQKNSTSKTNSVAAQSQSSATTNTTTASLANNPPDADKLAKRAARFADISVESATKKPATATNTNNSINKAPQARAVDSEILAKRQARFANFKAS